ncbi:hypothetical protein J4206_00170 [Candidatus Woesearchaeota archaeon]|nr:hypothetical protein [Candidatus Woesearchaeota archaeon]
MKNLKKRGAAIVWQKLIQYAIGAIVLVVLGSIVAGPLIKDSPIVAKILGFALPKYIEPEQGITYNEFKVSERITVANSLKALACGINTVALSKDDISDVDKIYCDKEYSPSENIIRKLDIVPGDEKTDDKIAEQLALEIAECMKTFKQSPSIKILPCVQLNPVEKTPNPKTNTQSSTEQSTANNNNNNNLMTGNAVASSQGSGLVSKLGTPAAQQSISTPSQDKPTESKITSYTINDIQSKVWREIEKLASNGHEGATQISSWLPDRGFNWDIGNKLTSNSYICITDNYQVHVTDDANICGLKQKTKCSDKTVSIKRNYGSTCMYCEKSKRLTDATALSINKQEAIKQLTEATTRCWKDFRKGDSSSRDLGSYENRHCAKFMVPPKAAFQKQDQNDNQNKYPKNFEITEEEFCNALAKEGSTGDDLTGRGSCSESWWNILGLVAEQYEWKLKGPIKPVDEETYLFICGDNSGGNEVFLTQNPDLDCPVKKEENIVNKFKCNVVGFELPQDIKDESYATNYINSFGDPKYLAYYQKFPKEEEYAWQYDPKTIISYTLGIRAGLAVVTAAFPLAKSAIKSAMAGKNVDEAVRLAQSLDKLEDAAARKETIEQIVKLVGASDEGIAAVLKTSIASQAYLAEALTGHITDNLLAKIASETAESAAGRLSEQSIARIASSFKDDLAELGIESASLRAEALANVLKAGGNKEALEILSMKLGDDVTFAIAAQNPKLLGYASKATNKIGFEKFLKTALSPENFPETQKLLDSSFKSLNAIKQSNPSLVQGITNNIGRNTKDTVISLAKDGTPCILAAGTLGLSAAAVVESHLVLAPPAYLLAKKAISLGAGPCSRAAVNNYFPLMVGVSFLMQKQDSKERKYASIGENKIGVVQPAAYVTDPALFSVERAKNHYIIMTKDETQDPNRLFFASPCKTDVAITQNYCFCKVSNNDAYYEVTDHNNAQAIATARKQPIEKIPDSSLERDYPWPNWDKLNEQERLEYLSSWSERTAEEQKIEQATRAISSKKALMASSLAPGLRIFDLILRQYPSEYSFLLKEVIPDKLTFLKMVYELTVNVKNYDRNIQPWQKEEFDKLSPKIESLTPEQYKDFIAKFAEFVVNQNLAMRNQVETCLYPRQEYKCITTDDFTYSIADTVVQSASDTVVPAITVQPNSITLPKRVVSIFLEKFEEESPPKFDGDTYSPAQYISPLFNAQILKFNYYQDKENIVAKNIIEARAKALFSSRYFDDKMKEFSFKLYKYTGKNKADAVKVCRDISQQSVPKKFGISAAEFTYEAVPCISVKPENIQQYTNENWNDGNNYCYSGDNPDLKIASSILSWTSIVGGIALTITTGGVAAAVVPAALELGSVAMDFMVEKCTTWPNHQAQGIIDCAFGDWI